jgi:predicted transcriptional regulator
MARRPSSTLTDAETRVMKVLWQLQEATVAEVVAALKKHRPATYSTTQTILRILEVKGYVAHEKAGRAFVFRAVVNQRQARGRALRQLLGRLFDGSPSLLLVNLLEDEHVDAAELKRLRKLIDEA